MKCKIDKEKMKDIYELIKINPEIGNVMWVLILEANVNNEVYIDMNLLMQKANIKIPYYELKSILDDLYQIGWLKGSISHRFNGRYIYTLNKELIKNYI